MKIRNLTYSMQDIGQRKNQEDSIYPSLSNVPQKSDLYILCDGMGGHERGEVASECVCKALSSYVKENSSPDDFYGIDDFKSGLSYAYDSLDSLDDDSEKKMGTTLTFVKFHKGGAFIAHIGDSRIYHIRPSQNEILFVTRDHSLINELLDLGEITLEEARNSSQKNIITRAMQPHQDKRASADCCNISDIMPGDYFFLCSDGMLEETEDNQLCNILSLTDTPDRKKIEILKKVTKDNKDNHSAHLIRITSVQDELVGDENHEEPQTKTKKGRTGKVIFVILALIILAITFFFISKKGDRQKTINEEKNTAQVVNMRIQGMNYFV